VDELDGEDVRPLVAQKPLDIFQILTQVFVLSKELSQHLSDFHQDLFFSRQLTDQTDRVLLPVKIAGEVRFYQSRIFSVSIEQSVERFWKSTQKIASLNVEP
jgi:hypothetical protein